jgi:hypothetical protein
VVVELAPFRTWPPEIQAATKAAATSATIMRRAFDFALFVTILTQLAEFSIKETRLPDTYTVVPSAAAIAAP